MSRAKVPETFVLSILFLFFLQALSDFIELIYAFGLLVTAFTIEVASIVLLFTPLLFLLFHKSPSRLLLLGLSYIAILARVLEPLLDPGAKLVASGISVGAFMLLFPALLRNRSEVRGFQIGSGLAIAVSLSIFFRTANSSLDISEIGIFQIISWLLAIMAAYLLWRTDLLTAQHTSITRSSSNGRLIGLAIGLAAVIVMISFSLASPTVMARWTGYSYPSITAFLVIMLLVFGLLLNTKFFLAWFTRRVFLSWNVLFVILLVLTILPHQMAFPTDPAVYPIDISMPSPVAAVFLFLMLVLSPVLFVDFMLFARQISMAKPSIHQIGISFAVAAFFFLMMVFFHVFTSVYDYAPVVGPLFRDRFWLVYWLAGIGLVVPLLLLRSEAFLLEMPTGSNAFPPIALGTMALLTVIALYTTAPRLTTPPGATSIRIMTYNIQQGYDAQGKKNLAGQLAEVQKVNPDILGLQEFDTARVANGNVDAVRYFADNLQMYSYYGPTTTTGTFGIALLSKYPIRNAKTFFMYSVGEQTAAIHAEIFANDQTYQIFVTHLGNDGPIVQLENILTRLPTSGNVIVMGDFNFRPATDQYKLITQTLADAWLLRWPNGKETPGLSMEKRIDHIFLSSAISVLEAEYIASPASDHPYLYAVVQP